MIETKLGQCIGFFYLYSYILFGYDIVMYIVATCKFNVLGRVVDSRIVDMYRAWIMDPLILEMSGSTSVYEVLHTTFYVLIGTGVLCNFGC